MNVRDWDVPCPHCDARIGWGCMKPHGGGYFYNRRPAFHLPRRILATHVRAHLASIAELEVARRPPIGYAVAPSRDDKLLEAFANVWTNLDQANTAQGIAAGYAESGVEWGVYEMREVQS